MPEEFARELMAAGVVPLAGLRDGLLAIRNAAWLNLAAQSPYWRGKRNPLPLTENPVHVEPVSKPGAWCMQLAPMIDSLHGCSMRVPPNAG